MVTEEVKKAKQRKVSAAEAKAQRRKDKAATKEQARLILLGQAELPTGVKIPKAKPAVDRDGNPANKKLQRKLERKRARRLAREIRALKRKESPFEVKKKGKLKDRRRLKEERRLAAEQGLPMPTALAAKAPAAAPGTSAAAAAAPATPGDSAKRRKLGVGASVPGAANASSEQPELANGEAPAAAPGPPKERKKKKPRGQAVKDAIAAELAETAAEIAAEAAAEAAEAAAAAAAATGVQPPSKKRKKAAASPPDVSEEPDEPTAAAAAPAEPAAADPPARPKKAKKPKAAAIDPAEEPVQPASAPQVSLPSSARAVVGDHSQAHSLPPLVKHLYQEAPSIAALSAADVASWREERSTVVKGCDLKPLSTFAEAGFPKALLAVTQGFAQPSPIQAQCWPIVLSGHDLVGNAATGSGKTLAFMLPALAHILAQPDADGLDKKVPQALVLTPTRELAQQILGVASEASEHVGHRCALAVGGLPKKAQAADLKRGASVVVATPGRLQDLVDSNMCKLHRVSFLVLDEADRMLDLGFEPAIRAIAQVTRADRQTLMFSATWPPGVGKLAADFLANPTRVNIGSAELAASHSIAQAVEVVEAHEKDGKLLGLLAKHHKSRTNRILVFVLYKKEAARVETLLQRKGWKAAAVHGDLSQDVRTKAVQGFKDGSVPLLVATDVAARGLDIPDVSLVINYSFPLTVEDYVHRVGRSGRAGQAGSSHTLFCVASDKGLAGGLVNVLKEAEQPVPPELAKLGGTVKKKESKLYGAHFKDVDPTAKATKITFDD